jgi:hypothetical protein
MPYVKKYVRDYYYSQGCLSDLKTALNVIQLPEAKGDLNFIIYSLVKAWLDDNGRNYFNISTLIGALEDCADELRRRELHPYEDKAIQKNGDI